MEAMEAKAGVMLIDEDTSATNFMIRDELMQRVIHRDMEPITPFIERIRELYEEEGISTVIVAGSSGLIFISRTASCRWIGTCRRISRRRRKRSRTVSAVERTERESEKP